MPQSNNHGRIGIDYFAHIGFHDPYVNGKKPVNFRHLTEEQILSSFPGDMYTDALQALGLTHVVTAYDNITAGPLYKDKGLKIMDHALEFSRDDDDFAGKAMFAQGTDMNQYPLEINDYINDIELVNLAKSSNFGFGGKNAQNSVWTMDKSIRVNIPLYGAKNSTQDNDGSRITTIRAQKDPNMTFTTPPLVAWGRIHFFLMNRIDKKYKFLIRMKVTDFPQPTKASDIKELFRITVKNYPESDPNKSSEAGAAPYKNILGGQSVDTSPEFILYDNMIWSDNAQVGQNVDLDNSKCKWFTFEVVLNQMPQRRNVDFDIYFNNNCTLEIDKVGFQDLTYAELYKPDMSIADKTNIVNSLTHRYEIGGTDYLENLENIYYDEPYLLTARIRSDLKDIIDTEVPILHGMDINGAYGPKWVYDYNMNYELTKKVSNKQRVNYILDDYYSIFRSRVYDNEELVQKSLRDKLTYIAHNTDFTPKFSLSSHAAPDLHLGMIVAMKASRGFRDNWLTTPDENDIPYFCGLQEQGEIGLERDDKLAIHLQVDYSDKNYPRAPKPNEILAQGNIAIAWGARGFMHYHIATRVDYPAEVNGATSRPVYGLFDEAGRTFLDPGSTADVTGWDQSPAMLQVPNERYYAVQKLISDTKVISDALMRTYWIGAESYDQRFTGSDGDDYIVYDKAKRYIESIKTLNSATQAEDIQSATYVEIGYFKKAYYPESGAAVLANDSTFFYVVNKRCAPEHNNNPTRDIVIKLDKSQFPEPSYLLKDYTVGRDYTIFPNEEIVLTGVESGTGRLLLLAPTRMAGGDLRTNLTYTQDSKCAGSISVPDHITLTVAPGATLSMLNGSKIVGGLGSTIKVGDALDTRQATIDFVVPNEMTQNGLYMYEGTISINKSNIKNAYTGIYMSGIASGEISNSTIEQNDIGIYSTNTIGSDGERLLINNNTIINNLRGIYVDAFSSPYILNNQISAISLDDRNTKGIYVQMDASPTLMGDGGPAQKGNVISNLSYGIYSSTAMPIINNEAGPTYNWPNNFINNGYNLYLYESHIFKPRKNIRARNTYWGCKTEAEIISKNYTNQDLIDYSHYLLLPTWTGSKSIVNSVLSKEKAIKSDIPEITFNGIKSSEDSLEVILSYAQDLLDNKEIERAKVVIDEVINGNNNLDYTTFAIKLLKKCYTAKTYPEYVSRLKELKAENRLKTAACWELVNADYLNRESYLAEILSNNSKAMQPEEEVKALYIKYRESIFNKENKVDTIARNYAYNRMHNEYPEHYLTHEIDSMFAKIEISANSKANKTMSIKAPEVVLDYQLSEAYPNPFNPSTKVNYTLKEKSNVSIKVYNIMGEMVKELMNSGQEKGTYSIIWNGENQSNQKVSSGIYIMQMKAKSDTYKQESFEKSIKLILMK